METPPILGVVVGEQSWPERITKAMAMAHSRNLARRSAVLAHPDLAARLCQPPLNYKRPEQWNGYMPPETCDGEYNESPQRAALIQIGTEAWKRHLADNAPRVEPPAPDQPDLLPEHEEQPALPAGAAGPAGPLDPGGQLSDHT